MKRAAPVLVALLVLFAIVWLVVERMPISESTKSSILRRLIQGFGLSIMLTAMAVGMMTAAVTVPWLPWAVAGGALVLTGTYTLTADILGLPGGTPAAGDLDGGDDLPDPCVVGPYMAGGRAYVCTR